MGVNQDLNLLSLTRQKLKMGPNDGCIPFIFFYILMCWGPGICASIFSSYL